MSTAMSSIPTVTMADDPMIVRCAINCCFPAVTLSPLSVCAFADDGINATQVQ